MFKKHSSLKRVNKCLINDLVSNLCKIKILSSKNKNKNNLFICKKKQKKLCKKCLIQ